MGKRAQEVLDFNLYLGPDDVWRAVPLPRVCECKVGCAAQPDCVCLLSGFYVPPK